MEFRDLQYFLAVAQEGNISAAAQFLHVAQPSLSRQMKELEKQLGKQLFIRGNRRITLTEEGYLLRKRAEEMLGLMQKTEKEIGGDSLIAGDISIAAAETQAVHFLTQAACRLRGNYPEIRYHIASGDTQDAIYQLDQGLIDFALLFQLSFPERYHFLELPFADASGVIMRRDSPLAEKQIVTLDDLVDKPLILSRLADGQPCPGKYIPHLNVVATYNLVYNATLMVEDGLGYAICFTNLINVDADSRRNLCCRPVDFIAPRNPLFVWKKDQPMSKACAKFAAEVDGLIKTRETNVVI